MREKIDLIDHKSAADILKSQPSKMLAKVKNQIDLKRATDIFKNA